VRDRALEGFAAEIGTDDPVCVAGGRTQWDVGGPPCPGTRAVAAPCGVVSHEPEEMVVRVGAGTTLADLDRVLAGGGQHVALEAADPERATVGGVLAVGRSGYGRLRYGPVRDTVLEVRAVTAGGEIVRAGAPLVKNVTGFDLCRLLVGSLGTLALLGQVVLRCLPRPEVATWWVGEVDDPFALHRALYRPTAVLWDGARTWVGLAGDPADVSGQVRDILGPPFAEVAAPPPAPRSQRWSCLPGNLAALPSALGGSGWLAEVGVGVVHAEAGVGSPVGTEPPRRAPGSPAPAPVGVVADLHRRIKERFDPAGRLNPGRVVLAGVV